MGVRFKGTQKFGGLGRCAEKWTRLAHATHAREKGYTGAIGGLRSQMLQSQAVWKSREKRGYVNGRGMLPFQRHSRSLPCAL
jgi:hypothetical protein